MTTATQLKIKPETDSGPPTALKHEARRYWIFPSSDGAAALITYIVKRGHLIVQDGPVKDRRIAGMPQ